MTVVPLPLIMGLLVPISTFFNLQSITVPDWLYIRPPESLSSRNSINYGWASNSSMHFQRPGDSIPHEPVDVLPPVLVLGVRFVKLSEHETLPVNKTISSKLDVICIRSYGYCCFVLSNGKDFELRCLIIVPTVDSDLPCSSKRRSNGPLD
jgi:hypothetical protein